MSPRTALAYGAHVIEAVMPAGSIIALPPRPPDAASVPVSLPVSLEVRLRQALDAPIGAAPLEALAAGCRRVLVIVSDLTRADPRAAILDAVAERLPPAAELVVAIANGTHPPCELGELGLPDWVSKVVNHDGRDPSNIVEIGQTSRGTPLRVNSALLETDLVIATGCIRPHYFAGFGAGVKAIFPGLGENAAIRVNHQLKQALAARAGSVIGNVCRDDLEEVLAHLAAPAFLLNLVLDPLGEHIGAVAGDVVEAFRRGARLCDERSRLRVAMASTIVVSDSHPVTASLYQASKLVAAVAPVLLPGGTIVIAADCADGIGPGPDGADLVNRAIYEIGLRPRLPKDHRIVLVSDLPRELVASTYCEWSASVEEAVSEPALMFPQSAAYLIIEPDDAPRH